MQKKRGRSADRAGLSCSFCGKSSKEVASLIAGGASPGVHICGACIGVCNQILAGAPTDGFADWTKQSDEALLANLPQARAAHEGTGVVLQQQIDELREREVSWTLIGNALGVSRQAAWERFG